MKSYIYLILLTFLVVNATRVLSNPANNSGLFDRSHFRSNFSEIPSVELTVTGTLHLDLVPPVGIANEGDLVTYTYTVSNTGNTSLFQVIITDPVATVSGGPIANLSPGSTNNTTFSATYTLTQADIDAGAFTCHATATGTPPSGSQVSDIASDTQTIVQLSEIDLIKSGTPDFGPDGIAQAGEAIYYSFLVVNTGNVTLYGVNIYDPLAPVGGGPIASLAPEVPNYTTFFATYVLTQTDIDNGLLTNTAIVSGTDPANNIVSHSDDHIQVLDQVMFIDMEKIGIPQFGSDGIPQAGEVINYNFLITNISNVTLTNVTVTDPLIQLTGNPIAVMLPGISDQTSFSGSHVITQGDIDVGRFVNVATVTSKDPGNADVTHTDRHIQPLQSVSSVSLGMTSIINPDLILPEGIANEGDQITYTFSMTNTGNTTLSNLMINIPAAILTGGPIASLAPGETDDVTFTASYILTQADIDAGSVVNGATVTGMPPSGPAVSAIAADTHMIIQISDIDLIKSGTPDFGPDGVAQAGETIHYSFLVVNTGNVTLTNVNIEDPLVTVTGGPIASLAPEVPNYTTFFANYTLTQSDIDFGSLTNTATVTGENPHNLVVSHSDDHIQPLGQVMQIDMEKIGHPNFGPDGIPQAGESIGYTFLISNVSNVTLTNVTVFDPLVQLTGNPIVSMPPGSVNQNAYTGVHIITQADIDSGHFVNVAAVVAKDPGNMDVSHSDRHMQPLAVDAHLNLMMTGTLQNNIVVPDEVPNAGDQIIYSFSLTNAGNITLTNLTLNSAQASVTGGPIVSLAPGETDNSTFTANYILTQADIDAGHVVISTTASGTPAQGPVVFAAEDNAMELISPSWTLTKTSQEAGFDEVGDVLHYLISVDNTGNKSVSNVVVADPGADEGLVTYLSGDDNVDNILDPAEVWLFAAMHTIIQGDLEAGHYNNTATVAGTPFAGTLNSVSGSSVVPAVTMVADTIAEGESICYSSLQTLLVAGAGASFTINSGGNATMIAGHSILFMPGTRVFPGGFLHGYISFDNCGLKSSLAIENSAENEITATIGKSDFTIFPNPTSGKLIFERSETAILDRVRVEFYNMHGERMMEAELSGERTHEFGIADFPPGLYVVKAITGGHVESFKLVKTK